MQHSKTQFCCSKFPWIRETISPKITDNLGMRSQKGSPVLFYTKWLKTREKKKIPWMILNIL
jgi:hypothetical protein